MGMGAAAILSLVFLKKTSGTAGGFAGPDTELCLPLYYLVTGLTPELPSLLLGWVWAFLFFMLLHKMRMHLY